MEANTGVLRIATPHSRLPDQDPDRPGAGGARSEARSSISARVGTRTSLLLLRCRRTRAAATCTEGTNAKLQPYVPGGLSHGSNGVVVIVLDRDESIDTTGIQHRATRFVLVDGEEEAL